MVKLSQKWQRVKNHNGEIPTAGTDQESGSEAKDTVVK
jgi:hypothetical protein